MCLAGIAKYGLQMATKETTGKRVLLVEDEEAAREATRRYLQFCGYEVDAAATAAEAIEMAARNRPQVLVCDCKLEKQNDGIEVARAISGKFGTVIIFVTAYSFSDMRVQLDDMDVALCMRKPIMLSSLASAIESLANEESTA
jgi:two-component system response regulator MprA